jgi:hypothetical protein
MRMVAGPLLSFTAAWTVVYVQLGQTSHGSSHWPLASLHVAPPEQVPHAPPPSVPHSRPEQFGAQHSPCGLHWFAWASQQVLLHTADP